MDASNLKRISADLSGVDLSAAHGQAMKGGHFFPEENPNDTAALIRPFLTA
jgi:pimeloyl-ACP methyl ester carboxylesterase